MVCSFFHISVSLSGKWNSNSGESSGFLGPGHCGNTESQRQNASWRERHSSRVSLEGLPTEKDDRTVEAEAGNAYCALDLKSWGSEKQPHK